VAETGDKRPLVLGLGNPGPEYEGTRHNRGREVVEELARRRGVVLRPADCSTRLALAPEVALAIPETFMNRSGYAARCLIERFGFDPARLLVVFDDFYLPLGSVRLRERGGAGGQKGMASVLECLRTQEIARLRLGIAPGGASTAAVEGGAAAQLQPDRTDFVLGRFAPDELGPARDQIARAADACEVWLRDGVAEAMTRFNRDPESP